MESSQDSEDGEILNDFDFAENKIDRAEADLVVREVRNFSALNGFVNIHLVNDQFMDRVSVSISSRKVSNKDKTMLHQVVSQDDM